MSRTTLLDALDLPQSAATKLEVYLELLQRWSVRINLSAARTPSERIATLIAPVAPWAEKMLPGRLLDVGSGNGSPGMVLALLRPDLAATLLEPRRQRWAFLREVARACGRDDIVVRGERLERYADPPAQNVTVRALALELEDLEPHVAEGGQLVVWGGPPRGQSAKLRLTESGMLTEHHAHCYRRDVSRETLGGSNNEYK